MAIIKNKKNSQAGYNQDENTKEQCDMEIDGMYPPSPDEYPGPTIQNQVNQHHFLHRFLLRSNSFK